jgi:hypothetical protein
MLPLPDAARAEANNDDGSFGPALPVGLAISEICWSDWSAKNKALNSPPVEVPAFELELAGGLLELGLELHAQQASTTIPNPITLLIFMSAF